MNSVDGNETSANALGFKILLGGQGEGHGREDAGH